MLALNHFAMTGRLLTTTQDFVEGMIASATVSLAIGACWGATKFASDILDDVSQQEMAHKAKNNQPKNL